METKAEFKTVLPKLVKITIFSDFDLENERDVGILRKVYDSLKIKTFEKGQIIIKEGDFGSDFYILYSGSVLVQRSTLSGDQMALAKLNSEMNVFFGETALISDDPRSATVIAETECKTLIFDSDDFLRLCDEEPLLGFRVTLQIARGMAATIRQTNSDKTALYEALFSEIADE